MLSVALPAAIALSLCAPPAADPRRKNGPPPSDDFFPIAVWLQAPRNAKRYRDIGINLLCGALERGRTVDVHALRHAFGTHLAKAGVPLRTAQAALRHSDPSLTANIYTDQKLLDVAGALEALPALPLRPREQPERALATGTCPADRGPVPLAQALARNPGFSCPAGSFPDKTAARSDVGEERRSLATSGASGEGRHALTSAGRNGRGDRI